MGRHELYHSAEWGLFHVAVPMSNDKPIGNDFEQRIVSQELDKLCASQWAQTQKDQNSNLLIDFKV